MPGRRLAPPAGLSDFSNRTSGDTLGDRGRAVTSDSPQDWPGAIDPLPAPPVTSAERLWIEHLYEEFRQGRRANRRLLLGNLRSDLPDDFEPEEIDPRLVRRSTGIRPLAIRLLDPGSEFLGAARGIFERIFEVALNEREAPDLDAEPLADELGFDPTTFSRGCDILRWLGLITTQRDYSGGDDDLGIAHTIRLEDEDLERISYIDDLDDAIARDAANVREIPSRFYFDGTETQRPITNWLSQTVEENLSDLRYEAPREHFNRAVEHFHGDEEALPDAVKEAALALESMLKILLDEEDERVGKMLATLRHRELLAPSLANSLDKVWGYASDAAGVRHGKREPPDQSETEAAFVVGLVGHALLLLRRIDPARI